MDPSTTDPAVLLRSGAYLRLLGLAAVLGVPLSAAAYGFLALVSALQDWTYDDLPRALGFGATPTWWPLPALTLAGLLVGAAIHWLPGRGGHVPAEGFKAGGFPAGTELPGVVLAALAGLGLGAVIGPEAPLIALGGGLAVLALRLRQRDVPAPTAAVVAASGSFAAISALLGSPLLGAFLLMEASGLGGATLGLVLLPGLLSAGVGALIFVGLDHWTGLGTFSLAIPDLPPVSTPTVAQFGWAVVIGLGAAVVGVPVRRLALALEPLAARWVLVAIPLAGLAIGAVAVVVALLTGEEPSMVLFSGQSALGPLLQRGPAMSAWVLIVLLAGKAIAYTISLAAFRGGPIFPALFIGATGGLALANLPGLPPVPAAAMGIAAMAAVMLRLPLTAVLLATLFVSADGLTIMPLVIVAVVVAYVASARLTAEAAPEPASGPAPRRAGGRPAPRSTRRG